jgi:hypothetical protein
MKLPDNLPEDHYTHYWTDACAAARKLTIQSGVFVNIFCDELKKVRHIYFTVGNSKCESLDEAKKIVKNKSFL